MNPSIGILPAFAPVLSPAKAFDKFPELRLESQAIRDHSDWLQWAFPVDPPHVVHRMVDRLLLGDIELESQLLEFRTGAGL